MTMIRRHWVAAIVSLWSVLLAGAGLLVWTNLTHRSAQGQEAPPSATVEPVKLDAESYGRLAHIRQRLGLAGDDLSAVGCDAAATEGVLRTLGEWYAGKKTELRDARRAVNRTRQALQTLSQKLHKRSSEAETFKGQYPQVKAAWESAVAAETALIETAIPAVEARLSSGQKILWSQVRASVGAPERYRGVPELTAAQLGMLRQAEQTRAFALAAARTARQRSEAQTAFAAKEASVLSITQKQAMAAVQANRQRCAGVVAETSRKVLPPPAGPTVVGQ